MDIWKMARHVLAGIIFSLSFIASVQADYQYEIRIGQTDTDQETRISNQFTFSPMSPPIFIGNPIPSTSSTSLNQRDSKDIRIGGTYYFNSVSTLAIPNQEAGFLGQQSQIYFNLSRSEDDMRARFTDDVNTLIVSNSTADSDEFRFGGEYIFPEDPWILGLEYLTSDSTFKPSGASAQSTDSEVRQWRYTVGYYPTDRNRIRFSYIDSKRETVSQINAFVSPVPILNPGVGFNPFGLPQRITIDSEQSRVDYRHLFDIFESQFLAVNLDYNQLSQDLGLDATAYSLGLDYYPFADLSFGVSYGENKPDGGSGQSSYVYRVKYFINERVAVSLVAQDSEDRESRVDNDPFVAVRTTTKFARESLSLGIDVRF